MTIRSEWRTTKLVDVAAKKRWALNGGPFGSKLSRKHYSELGVPVIRGTNISGASKFSFDDFVYVSEEKADELQANNARPGDLIFTQRGTIGQVGLIPFDSPIPRFVISQSQMKLTVDPEQADALFLYYFFSAPDTVQAIQNLAFAAGVPHINLDILRKFETPIPPLPQQQRIASILSAYDELIENSQRRIQILEEMARTLYREWFVDFRSPGHEKVKLVPSTLGLIPHRWEIKTLGEIAENFDRLRKPLSKIQRAEIQGEYPYYGAAKVFDHINDFIFDGEYLLVAEDGSVITLDRAPVLQLVNEKFWPNNHTHVLRGKAFVSTHFLYLGLSLVDISPYITGAAQPKITQENMNRIPFVCGPDETHHKFDVLVSPLIHQTQALQRQTANLRRTRDLLLPRLLSGQIPIRTEASR